MRLEIDAAETRPEPPAPLRPAPGRRARRWDPVEVGAFVVLFAMSLWTVGLDVWQVVVHGRVWTHTDGIYIVDQMMYLSWVRDAAHHVLASNLFVLRATPHDYLQPGVVISAALTLLGVAPWLALMLWKPVAIVCVFLAFRSYIHRTFPDRAHRRVGLVLALFFGSYSLIYGSWSVIGDLMPVFLSWGYSLGLLALGLMVLAVLAYERAWTRRRLSVLPGVLGAVASLLHPWQGELLCIVVVGSELLLWRERPVALRERVRLPALTVLITGLALLYYLILGRADESWTLARVASKHAFSLWSIVLATALLIVPALVAWRPRRRTFMEIVTRVWLLAALAVWVFSASALSATPLHSFQGITLPLAVLAVEGVSRLRPERWLPRPRLALLAVLGLLTIPANVELLHVAATLAAPTFNNPNFISPSERDALAYLNRDPTPGGVLTRMYLGTVIPGLTDRQTFVGDCLWSEPNCFPRINRAQALFAGSLTAPQAQAFVRATGARFVLTDCQQPADLRETLAPLIVSVRTFGCASVYELVPPTAPSGPLAESPPHAAVRTSWRQ